MKAIANYYDALDAVRQHTGKWAAQAVEKRVLSDAAKIGQLEGQLAAAKSELKDLRRKNGIWEREKASLTEQLEVAWDDLHEARLCGRGW